MFFPFRDLIKKLLVVDKTKRLGNLRVSDLIVVIKKPLKHYEVV